MRKNRDNVFKGMIGIEGRHGEGDIFDAFRRYYISPALDQLFAGGDADKTMEE